MGTRKAPSIDNLHLRHVEKANILNKKSNHFLEDLLVWKHYIYDIFVVYKVDLTSLMSLHQFLNSMNEHLESTSTPWMYASPKQVPPL